MSAHTHRPNARINRRSVLRAGAAATAATAMGGGVVRGQDLRFPSMQASPEASPAASPAADLQPWEPRYTDDVTLRRFGFGTDNITSEVRAAAFEEAYPNFSLEVTPEITDQKVLTAVASGDVPDMFWLASNSIQTWAARGALEPLDELIENDDRFDLSQFYESEIAKVTYDGKIYAIPQFVDCRPMWLDHQSLSDAGLTPDDIDPSNWDQLREQGVSMTIEDNGQIKRWGFDTKAADFFWMWSWGNGGDLLSEDGREATFVTDENIEALQYNIDTFNAQGGYNNFQAFIQTTGFDGAENFFVQSQVAITPFENWLLGIVAQGAPEHEFTLKPFMGKDGTPYSITGGQSWAIPTGAENKDAAWEWISFFSSPTVWRDTSVTMKERLEGDGRLYTPALTASHVANTVLNTEVFTGTGNEHFDNAIQLFPELLDANTSSAASPVLSELNDIIMNSVVKPALSEERSAEDALNEGQTMAQRALDDFFR